MRLSPLLSEVHMRKRRLLFHNDARHFHIYCYDPPIRVEDAVAPVDEIVGTGVDTLVYGFGAGPTMYHNTKVGETWAEHLIKAGATTFREPEIWNTFPFWRAYENLRSLRERGLDIMTLLIDRAHSKGIEFFGSLRMNHGQDPAFVQTADNSTFKIDNPELCLKTRPGYPFDWTYPEVRAERYALIEEAVTDYEVDGFEIDFVFSPYYFEQDEEWGKAHIVTDFIRDVQTLITRIGNEKGRHIPFGARIMPTVESNTRAGLDVRTWLREELLDFVVQAVYGPRQMDVNMPFEWLVEEAEGTDCEVYPALQDRYYSVGTGGIDQERREIYEYPGTPERFRAGAASYWSRGADGLYIPWFNWPFGAQERQILSEIHDPDLIREQPKHYWLGVKDIDADYEGYESQLPVTLETGNGPSFISIQMAEVFKLAQVTLKVQLRGSIDADVVDVIANGVTLDPDKQRFSRHGGGGNIYALMELPIPSSILKVGTNEIGISIESRPANLAAQVAVDSVEMFVDYARPTAATTFDRISRGERVGGFR